MDDNRYKRLTNLFINRINTIEMMNIFEGKSKTGLKVYRQDSDDYYHYLFTGPIVGGVFNRATGGYEIKYELYLNKHKNLAVIVYHLEIVCNYGYKQFTTTYAMSLFKKARFTRYSYDTKLVDGFFAPKIKVKAVIEDDMDMSKVFQILDAFDEISRKAVNIRGTYYKFDSYDRFKKFIENSDNDDDLIFSI